jgi:flagellar protein FlgJ
MSTISTSPVSSTATETTSTSANSAQIKQAAQKFESMLLRQMLSEARKVDFGNTLFTNEGTKTFREMQDSNFADTVAKRGTLGFAKMIEAQLTRQTQGTPTVNSTPASSTPASSTNASGGAQ